MDPRENLSTSNSYSYSRVAEQNIQQRTGGSPRGHTALPPARAWLAFKRLDDLSALSSSRCAAAEETRVLPAHAHKSDCGMTARS